MPKKVFAQTTCRKFWLYFILLFLVSCTTNPTEKVYYKSAESRGVSLNETFTVISTVKERDGVQVGRTGNTDYRYKLTQDGRQIRMDGGKGSSYFYPISLQEWRQQAINYDFIKKLPNPEKAMDSFLGDVSSMYVGGSGRIYMRSRVKNGKQEILDLPGSMKHVQIIQKDRSISLALQGIIIRTFVRDDSVFNTIPRDNQWALGFTESASGAVLLSNATRTLLTVIESDKKGAFIFTNFLIEDGLFKLKEGKFKYSFLSEDNTVETAFLMPTRNFTCAELTQHYYDKQLEAGVQIASSILLGIIQSYVEYSSTTMSGNAYSYQTGNTYSYSGGSTTHDYSYVGERAGEVMGAIAYGALSTIEIKRLMRDNNCIIP